MPKTTGTVPTLDQLMQTLEADTTVEKIDEGLESSDDEELVAAGNSKKFLDEINYLFEGACAVLTAGLLSSSLAIQRSACFELFKKMGQEGFINALRIHGAIRRIYAGLKDQQDQ
ncbi:hypothetical protein HDU91_003929, partial [Kappamyces sp. JEL0680]